MTNADKIRNMSDEELAEIILCPYETAGDESEIMPCMLEGKQTVETCRKCCVEWLKREVKVETSAPWKDHVMQRFTRGE